MSRPSLTAGVLAAAGLGLVYALVVGGFGGTAHLAQQAAADWPWLAAILAGFGTQIALYAELRHRRRLAAGVSAAAGAGGTASTVGMVACCAHHAAALAPLIGASAAAVFLTAYRVPIMLIGIAVNAVGVAVAVYRLRQLHTPARHALAGRHS